MYEALEVKIKRIKQITVCECDKEGPGMTPKVFSFVNLHCQEFLEFGKWTVFNNSNLKAVQSSLDMHAYTSEKSLFEPKS